MDIQEYESLITESLDAVIEKIIKDNKTVNIRAYSRAGAEISDWLEEKFVEYTKDSEKFKNSEFSPKGHTKNPWDARTVFIHNDISEEIWIDFKAFKLSSVDSNPDIGTPNKIIKFIEDGNFYHAFIYVYYESNEDDIEFVQYKNHYTKIYFLKDVNDSVRRNPKNQLQVNIASNPTYRSREEFINLLMEKIKESHIRQINISNKALDELDDVKTQLINKNKESEGKLIKKLK